MPNFQVKCILDFGTHPRKIFFCGNDHWFGRKDTNFLICKKMVVRKFHMFHLKPVCLQI